ncbi:adenine deaminase [Methanobacterium formicicum]|uniref:Adenine deaminase n=1 Tax=Methanobacterium formicicum TaxID=2162 RepID=A0A089ZHC9_METFO|nr:adenine deaminase [Methanobacterium formicicum]AIS32720.1 adenine deaminase Ade [Methanobacterium formicicum]CEL24088.1 Adenine deaminase [Methanobacterium formicicum]
MIKGNLVNLFTEEIYPAEVEIQEGKIKCVREVKGELDNYILPGFIDAHIHIESSMLTPSRFAQMVVPHGTTAVVADPHEIANVQGLAGVNYMIQDAANVPLQFFFTAPSCVPATPFETSGAVLGPEEIDNLLQRDDVVALGEMMNFPGVIGGDPVVLEKIRLAHEHSKPVDGHAPLLSGDDLCNYIARGISTEHECSLREEALEKKRLGMRIMVREGSSAQNLEELWTVGGDFLVSDDRHPQDLLEGHLDQTLKKAVELGMDPLKAIQMVTVHPASHYHLDTGSVTPGKSADLVVVDDLEKFNVKKVFIKGELVAREGKPLFNVQPLTGENTFQLKTMMPSDFEIQSTGNGENTVRVIEVMEGQLLTEKSQATLESVNGILPGDIEQDVLQIAVVERYGNNHHSNAFVKGFSLKKGAIASSVAHDSHNIIVVGTNTKDMAVAVNTLKKNRGGLVTVGEGVVHSLKLPIAGLMSTQSAEEVANQLNQLQEFTKAMGCKLSSPFMTLSFMALLVIPKLKISDQGLFDGESFQFVDVIK